MDKRAVWAQRQVPWFKRLWLRLTLRWRYKRWLKKHPPIYWTKSMPKKQPCPKHQIWCLRTGPVRDGGCWYWCPQCVNGFWVTQSPILREIERREQV